jgi:hypothetical protein
LPGPFNDLDRVVIKELPMGVVLSFNYGRHMVLAGPPASYR